MRHWAAAFSASFLLLPVAVHAQAPPFLLQWGGYGTADDQMQVPVGVAADNSGHVFVSDNQLYRVQKFNSDGTYVSKWGSYGFQSDQFQRPSAIAADQAGNVYVGDFGLGSIKKFSGDGTFLTSWNITGIPAIGPSGDVYVLHLFGQLYVNKYTSNGAFELQFGSQGSGDGQFLSPQGIAVDGQGFVYITDGALSNIQKFTSTGAFVTKWNLSGTIFRLAADARGYVYAMDYNGRVLVFTSDGSYLTQWGSAGSGPGQFNRPIGICVDANLDVYVADTNNSRVEKFGQVPVAAAGTTWGRLRAMYR